MNLQRGRVKILQKAKPNAKEEVTGSSPAKVAAVLFGSTTAHGFYRYDPNTSAIAANTEAPKAFDAHDALEGQKSGTLIDPKGFDGKAAADIQEEPRQVDKAGGQETVTPTEASGMQKLPHHIDNDDRPWTSIPVKGPYRGRGRGRGLPRGHGHGHGLQGRGGQEPGGQEKVRGRGHWAKLRKERGDGSAAWNSPKSQEASAYDQAGGSRVDETLISEYGVPVRIVERHEVDSTIRRQFQPHREGFNKIVNWLDVLDITSTECDPEYPGDNLSSISLRSRSPSPAKAPQKGQPSTAAKRKRVQKLPQSPGFEVEIDEAGGVKSMEIVYEEMKSKAIAPPPSSLEDRW